RCPSAECPGGGANDGSGSPFLAREAARLEIADGAGQSGRGSGTARRRSRRITWNGGWVGGWWGGGFLLCVSRSARRGGQYPHLSDMDWGGDGGDVLRRRPVGVQPAVIKHCRHQTATPRHPDTTEQPQAPAHRDQPADSASAQNKGQGTAHQIPAQGRAGSAAQPSASRHGSGQRQSHGTRQRQRRAAPGTDQMDDGGHSFPAATSRKQQQAAKLSTAKFDNVANFTNCPADS
ncbi:hypothetical protein BV898_19745, partial [Hypsibius exemplaris]